MEPIDFQPIVRAVVVSDNFNFEGSGVAAAAGEGSAGDDVAQGSAGGDAAEKEVVPETGGGVADMVDPQRLASLLQVLGFRV